MDTATFESFGLDEKTLAAIGRKGFEEPTPIQALTIPRLLKHGPDLIARARTGTGKPPPSAFLSPSFSPIRQAISAPSSSYRRASWHSR